jgi:AmmeMemoRadiSam system protein B
VAGQFYPDDPAELRDMVEGFLREAKVEQPLATPKAIIAPHAGYIYSGPIAASAYARLGAARDTVKRVVLLGPSHRVPFRGLAASSAEAFATPLGPVPVDAEGVRELLSLSQVAVLDQAHAYEHSLEVHLPFLQVVLADFKIVPLVVGDASDEEVAEVIEALWGGDETRFVISSDLSHYLDYTTAQKLDQATARAIESLKPQNVGVEQACGRIPVRGLLHAARRHGLRVRTADLRNSGDTAGPRHQVVGYGAWTFEEAAK